MNWIRFFIFMITIEFWRLNCCPITHCSCDGNNLWTCLIAQNEDQIDCNSRKSSSEMVNVNLELRSLNIDRKNSLFINTNKCKIRILKISTNLIPSNQLIGNINSLNYLIIEGIINLETQFESNMNNFLYGLSRLSRLKIENINLHNWSKENLETCDSISELEFKNLKIESIDFGSFINCKKLTKLTIRFNNILKIYSASFKGLNQLLNLILSSNQCEELITNENGWWDLRNLTKLDLSNNKLTKLKFRLFIGLSKLEQLNLNANPIVFIDNSAFEGLNNLKSINLKNNHKLKSIDLNYFNPVKSSLTDLLVDKEFLVCFHDQIILKQFSLKIQQTLKEVNDCAAPNIITTLSLSNNTFKLKERVNNLISPTLMIIVAVLVTLLIVMIFVGVFIYWYTKKKIRKYKINSSDRLTSHSSSFRQLDGNQETSHTYNYRKPPYNDTMKGLAKYKSSPSLMTSET